MINSNVINHVTKERLGWRRTCSYVHSPLLFLSKMLIVLVSSLCILKFFLQHRQKLFLLIFFFYFFQHACSRAASAPGVNPALQMRSLALSTVGEFEKERTRLVPKSDFFLAWEIGCVAWERVKTCKSVCHTAKPWELAALVQLSSVDNNYASLNIRHILRCSDWL